MNIGEKFYTVTLDTVNMQPIMVEWVVTTIIKDGVHIIGKSITGGVNKSQYFDLTKDNEMKIFDIVSETPERALAMYITRTAVHTSIMRDKLV